MSGFQPKWLHTRTCGLDGVTGGFPTLQKQGCSLTGLHSHFLVVPSSFAKFLHKSWISIMSDFRYVFRDVDFINVSYQHYSWMWLVMCMDVLFLNSKITSSPMSRWTWRWEEGRRTLEMDLKVACVLAIILAYHFDVVLVRFLRNIWRWWYLPLFHWMKCELVSSIMVDFLWRWNFVSRMLYGDDFLS